MSKENRPAEMEAPTGTITITLPDYNMFSPEEQEKAVKLMELFWMALQANGMYERRLTGLEDLPSMKVEFDGYLSKIEIFHRNSGILRHAYADMDDFWSKAEDLRLWLRGVLMGMKNHDA